MSNRKLQTFTISVTHDMEKTIVKQPISVDEMIEKIIVSYSVSGLNTVDLGMMQGDVVTGWSGGSKKEIEISRTYSTPGYERWREDWSNDWSILLGLYKIPIAAEITIDVTYIYKESRWLKGDTHMHSMHSDGKLTIAELVQRAEKMGYDYAFFTDHNTMTQNDEIRNFQTDITLIPGVELTTDNGHTNFVGVDKPIEQFLPSSTYSEMQVKKHEARENGAYIGMNHPFCLNCPWLYPLEDYDWLEIWNGPWINCTQNETAFLYWIEQLRLGHRIVVTAGSDFHKEKGERYTDVYIYSKSKEQNDILNGLLNGAVYMQSDDSKLVQFSTNDAMIGGVSSTGDLTVELKTNPENTVKLYTGKREITVENRNGLVVYQDNFLAEGFVLLRVDEPDSAVLITNPIYMSNNK